MKSGPRWKGASEMRDPRCQVGYHYGCDCDDESLLGLIKALETENAQLRNLVKNIEELITVAIKMVEIEGSSNYSAERGRRE